jgi:hypothetical protein
MEWADSEGALPEALASAIDGDFYQFTYGELPAGETAASHYASIGWRQGHDPNPWFSTQAYLEENPGVGEAGQVPLFHFLEIGADEGKECKPSRHAAAYFNRSLGLAPGDAASDAAPLGDAGSDERLAIRGEFDPHYYLTMNEDVAQAGVDPLAHFIEFGWREGRDPNAYFSTKAYLDENPDVESAGIDPFYHYIVAGRAEGRRPRPMLGFRYDVLLNQDSLDKRMAGATQVAPSQIRSKRDLLQSLSSLTRSGRQRLYVSVSHDDFFANVGGVQLCLQLEAAAFSERGFDRLHLFPGHTLPVTNDEENPASGVFVNDEFAGYFRTNTIANALREAVDTKSEWPERTFAVHSLLGHNVRSLTSVLKSLHMSSGYFWLHDYASICSGLQLLRDDVEFCGAPNVDSTACEICLYGERRRLQIADHAFFFGKFALTALAPSQTALDTWKRSTDLAARGGERIQPHCRLVPRSAKHPAAPGATGVLRVAYLGQPAVHKGWPVFRDLVLRHAGDRRYEFYHLGLQPQAHLPVHFVEVRVNSKHRDAMIERLEELDIDVAIVWSLWPETFCIAAYEAVAAGAMVVAPPYSGNVAKMVGETGKGIVLRDERELMQFFESSEVRQLARSKRGVEHFTLEFGDLTAAFVSGRR